MTDGGARGIGPMVTRRLVTEDAFRALKLLFGLVLLGSGSFWLWTGHSNALACVDTSCVVEQHYALRGTKRFSFDARRPPAVVVGRARVGRSDQGKRVVLRYEDGSEVELARGLGAQVEAQATELRAYLAHPRGAFSLRQPDPVVIVAAVTLASGFGLLLSLDGLGLAGWHRLGLDRERRVLAIDRVVFGVRAKRQTFAISPATSVGRAALSPRAPHLFWLTLDTPGRPSQVLPFRDRPKARAMLERMLAGS